MLIKENPNQTTGTKMEEEIKKPYIKRPDFSEPDKPAYDYRNMEDAGKFRGVGQAGKVGKKSSDSINAMPPEKKKMKVPRDHEG
jgi:hypothetical protein